MKWNRDKNNYRNLNTNSRALENVHTLKCELRMQRCKEHMCALWYELQLSNLVMLSQRGASC
jgi:hypothetical protein